MVIFSPPAGGVRTGSAMESLLDWNTSRRSRRRAVRGTAQGKRGTRIVALYAGRGKGLARVRRRKAAHHRKSAPWARCLCGSGVSREWEPDHVGNRWPRITAFAADAAPTGARAHGRSYTKQKRRGLLRAPTCYRIEIKGWIPAFAGMTCAQRPAQARARLRHLTSISWVMPAGWPLTVTSTLYLPAGHGVALVNSTLVVPASSAFTFAVCCPATWPS